MKKAYIKNREMEESSFSELLIKIQDHGDLKSQDFESFTIPLTQYIANIHAQNKVLKLNDSKKVIYNSESLQTKESQRELSISNKILFKKSTEKNSISVSNEYKQTIEVNDGYSDYENTNILKEFTTEINKPVYFLGYRSWEESFGHFDPVTEVYCVGLIFASLAFGLNFYEKDDLEQFINNKHRLYYLNKTLHPSLLELISNMTELYREDRIQDFHEVLLRIKNYRDVNPENVVDLTKTEGFKTLDTSKRSHWILNKLKNRLYDMSRRNNLLYYKDKDRFVNLTISSIPHLLDHKNIKEKDLLLWNNEIEKKVKSKKQIDLNQYLQFETNKYLPAAINKIRLEARKSNNEFGFNPQRTVLAYINWYNFKENPEEKIRSPFLLLKTNLVKKKGVKDKFTLEFQNLVAEVNPVLSQYFNDNFGIILPDFVDLEESSIEDLTENLKTQIDNGGTGVRIFLNKKPRIKLMQVKARKKLNLKKQKSNRRSAGFNLKNLDYSYESNQFKPLGLEIFKSRIKHKNQALEYLINEDLMPSTQRIVADTERSFYFHDEEGESNPLNWEIDTTNMTIGNFNYRKMSLVRDYNHIIEAEVQDDVFNKLFSEIPKRTQQEKELRNIANDFPIISSDPTQNTAVSHARSGESYVIQGPPGTGKSQTITNLIADYISKGKKVLFVCEKRAALDVVYHRLKSRELDDLCILVHDTKSDKKEFIQNLKGTYEVFSEKHDNKEKLIKERTEVVQKIQEELNLIQKYHQEMSTGDNPAYELVKIILEHKEGKENLSEKEYKGLPSFKYLEENLNWLEDWIQLVQEKGLGKYISECQISHLNKSLFSTDKTTINDQIQELEYKLDALLEDAEISSNIALEDFTISEVDDRINIAKKLRPIYEKGKLDILDAKSNDGKDLILKIKEHKKLLLNLDLQEQGNKNWNSNLTLEDSKILVDNWKLKNSGVLKFLNPGFYKIKNEIKQLYNFDAHQVKPSIESIIKNLEQLNQCKSDIESFEHELLTTYGIQDINEQTEWVLHCQNKNNKLITEFCTSENFEEITFYSEIENTFIQLKNNLFNLFNEGSSIKIESISNKYETLKLELNHFPSFKTFLEKLKAQPENFQELILNKKWTISEFSYHFAYGNFLNLMEKYPQTNDLEAGNIEGAISNIKELLESYFESNVKVIKSEIVSKFLNQIRITESTAAQLTEDEKYEKKNLKSARRILENEFGKSMRYKSVRELFNNEAHKIMTTLKPVWLMSPLSVSDIMPIDQDTFDVVIFDEASQITLEEGVPALFRSKQIIVVGDEMQMPPTNFFGSNTNLEEEDAEEEIGFSLDADSILNQSSRKLSNVMLGWHYRSRRESLISFSNAAFYNRSLLTIPDAHKSNYTIEETVGISSPEDTININNHLQKSISYHYLENGLYEKRSNKDEARYIARLVRELLVNDKKLSIGIVAFSMEQQGEIENALEILGTQDPAFDALLEEEYQKEEDDQFNGLFVKNLENVQGDERDVIIMSICYAHNAKGKMYMNFGPINRRGGEKRLNVIFSRSKMHMMVVTSILPHEITNDYNEGANYFKKFLSYSKLISEGSLRSANTILDGLNKIDEAISNTESHVLVKQIESALLSKGYEVRKAVGQSNFKCDLAVNSKHKPERNLAILIDHEQHYSNADILEQYVLRPSILSNFGWSVTQVYAKDWLLNPDYVLSEIERVLKSDKPIKPKQRVVKKPESVDFEKPKSNDIIAVEPKTKEIEEKNIISTATKEFTRLEFIEGTSSKFWQIKQTENNIEIEFGRIGNKAQNRVKEFQNNELAKSEMNKMIAKKLAKGYKKVY